MADDIQAMILSDLKASSIAKLRAIGYVLSGVPQCRESVAVRQTDRDASTEKSSSRI